MVMPLALPYSQGSHKSGRNALVPSNGDFVTVEVRSVTINWAGGIEKQIAKRSFFLQKFPNMQK